jgi:glutamine amidotransferase
VNLCISTGEAVVATRLSFDYGWYPPEDEMLETDLPFVSLWYAIGGQYTDRDGGWQMTAGDPPRSVIIASEPLTADVSTWLEVPEYSLLTAELTPEGLVFETRDLHV